MQLDDNQDIKLKIKKFEKTLTLGNFTKKRISEIYNDIKDSCKKNPCAIFCAPCFIALDLICCPYIVYLHCAYFKEWKNLEKEKFEQFLIPGERTKINTNKIDLEDIFVIPESYSQHNSPYQNNTMSLQPQMNNDNNNIHQQEIIQEAQNSREINL